MNSSDNFQDSALSRLMPLMNSSFTPGQAQATVDNFQDLDQRQIAQAELYYFSGRAEECRNIAELYLQDKDLCLRLSAALFIFFFPIFTTISWTPMFPVLICETSVTNLASAFLFQEIFNVDFTTCF